MSSNQNQAYRCNVCGFIHRGDQPTSSCPVCGSPSSEFVLQEESAQEALPQKVKAESWQCMNCKFIHKDSDLPEGCPVCGVDGCGERV